MQDAERRQAIFWHAGCAENQVLAQLALTTKSPAFFLRAPAPGDTVKLAPKYVLLICSSAAPPLAVDC
jgi:hypothetical protein